MQRALCYFVQIFLLLVLCLPSDVTARSTVELIYWLRLDRFSNVEMLYFGVPGESHLSNPVQVFKVKTGRPGERPTPLPQYSLRKYWLITGFREVRDDPETAPYFLDLDIPGGYTAPYFGPVPYTECAGMQCSWMVPGAFGLHGVAGDGSRLAADNPGSSGCIRHTDRDISYLYDLLKNSKTEIRYYVTDKSIQSIPGILLVSH